MDDLKFKMLFDLAAVLVCLVAHYSIRWMKNRNDNDKD